MPGVKSRRIYDEAVRDPVILVWEASDRVPFAFAGRPLTAVSCSLALGFLVVRL